MRTSAVVTISLPHPLMHASDRIAKKQHMTRSELLRTALRQYLEEQSAQEAIAAYRKEERAGTLRVLKGSLATLMG